MIKQLTNSITKLAVLSVVLAGVLTVNYLNAAWQPPSAAPTGGNVDLPINTGGVSQEKDGVLTVGALWSLGLGVITGGTRSLNYCDLSGNNCSTPADIYNTVNASPVDTSTFINTSSDAQTKAGALTVSDRVKSPLYCDANGNNCITPSNMGGSLVCASARVSRNDEGTWARTVGGASSGSYSFTNLISSSGLSGSTIQATCNIANGWIMTGCDGSRNAMYDGNRCRVPLQYGEASLHIRCCKL